MFVTFQFRGLYHLEQYCTLTIEARLILNIHLDCSYLELYNACIISLVFIVFNVRDGTESKYPSIVLLRILLHFIQMCFAGVFFIITMSFAALAVFLSTIIASIASKGKHRRAMPAWLSQVIILKT